MELKQYQKEVLKEVGRFARTYAQIRDAATAYGVFMNAVGLEPGKGGVERYRDDLGGRAASSATATTSAARRRCASRCPRAEARPSSARAPCAC